MKMAVIRYILLAALVGLCLGKKRYDGYKVLRVTPNDDTQLQSMVELKRNLEGKVDFWAEPSHAGKTVDLMVGPVDVSFVRAMLARHGLESSVMIEDVQRLADQSTVGQQGGIASLSNFRYDIYHTFPEIMAWIDDMVSKHGDIANRIDLGYSLEGNKLSVLKLGKPGSNKPIFWLHSGTHSREWLSPATALKMVDMFTTKYNDGDSEIVNLLDNVDFYIMPMFNPDGYIYSYTYDRMWRKTRGSTSLSWCTGVDPNRNWNDHWDHPQSDTYPCSQAYRGPYVFSEVEVKTVADYILSSLSNVQVFIDMHCYSQLWMVPYGWSKSLPSNYHKQKSLADLAMAALKTVNGLTFRTGSISNILYLAPGSSIDWAYSQAGIPYAFAPELRDQGYYGFLMPGSSINPSAMEVFEAIKVIGNHVNPNK